ncbi:hypothetical protein EJB05_44745, partial [Eragrostis curvula]
MATSTCTCAFLIPSFLCSLHYLGNRRGLTSWTVNTGNDLTRLHCDASSAFLCSCVPQGSQPGKVFINARKLMRKLQVFDKRRHSEFHSESWLIKQILDAEASIGLEFRGTQETT